MNLNSTVPFILAEFQLYFYSRKQYKYDEVQEKCLRLICLVLFFVSVLVATSKAFIVKGNSRNKVFYQVHIR